MPRARDSPTGASQHSARLTFAAEHMQTEKSVPQRACIRQAAGCQQPACSGLCPKTQKPKIACSIECFNEWKSRCGGQYQAWKETGKLPMVENDGSGSDSTTAEPSIADQSC